MADLYALVHRDTGPVTTFIAREDAEQELEDVLRDEPTWADDLWIEPFELVVEGSGTRASRRKWGGCRA